MTASNRPEICEETVFEGARTILCVVDPAAHEARLVYRDGKGQPYGSVPRAVAALAAAGRTPVLAMNAGMYHADMTPVGLYVEDGAVVSPLNPGDGFGNFFLKPNGVFFIRADGSAGVMESGVYAEAEIDPLFATQSGPMLVIDGAIHPRFLPDGTTRYIRNGVGVRGDGKIVLAITRDEVSLGLFGRLFRDLARCPNALFFDGAVSSLAWGSEMEIDSGEPAGPVVAVFAKTAE
ncbi:MAG: phosphodiester glycosidase family protein [Hoeflea sp.]|nr:phosphodiester glycosidase family protein [Hoeflea sp.]